MAVAADHAEEATRLHRRVHVQAVAATVIHRAVAAPIPAHRAVAEVRTQVLLTGAAARIQVPQAGAAARIQGPAAVQTAAVQSTTAGQLPTEATLLEAIRAETTTATIRTVHVRQ